MNGHFSSQMTFEGSLHKTKRSYTYDLTSIDTFKELLQGCGIIWFLFHHSVNFLFPISSVPLFSVQAGPSSRCSFFPWHPMCPHATSPTVFIQDFYSTTPRSSCKWLRQFLPLFHRNGVALWAQVNENSLLYQNRTKPKPLLNTTKIAMNQRFPLLP